MTRRDQVRADRQARRDAPDILPPEITLEPLPRTPPKGKDARAWFVLCNGGPRDAERSIDHEYRGRLCGACSEPLDKQGHERKVVDVVEGDEVVGKERVWVCRVRRLVDETAAMLDSHERKVIRTFVPSDDVNQRTKENNLRFTPIRLIKARA
jgi:hypothetical protein